MTINYQYLCRSKQNMIYNLTYSNIMIAIISFSTPSLTKTITFIYEIVEACTLYVLKLN